MILFFRSPRVSLRKRDDYSWSKAFANLRSGGRSFPSLCSVADLSAPSRRKYAYRRLQKFPSVPLLGFSDSSALQLFWLNRKLLPLRKTTRKISAIRGVLSLCHPIRVDPKSFSLTSCFSDMPLLFIFLVQRLRSNQNMVIFSCCWQVSTPFLRVNTRAFRQPRLKPDYFFQ